MTERHSHGVVCAPAGYRPRWWLPEGHSQTLWAALARRPPLPPIARERLELQDGDFLDLVHAGDPAQPGVLILHGLEGSLESPYVRALLSAIVAQGWYGVLMHFRGCGGEFNRVPRNYHSGDTRDLTEVLAILRARQPNRVLAAVGYSMGGNVLLKYLGETGASTALVAAAAVSVPFELGRAADRLNRGFSRVYQRHLVGSLQRKLRAKAARMAYPIDLTELEKWRDFHTYDERVTAPLHGFRDAADYYAKSSCRPFLRHIAIPTLLVHAVDDPFLPPDAIPVASDLAPPVRLELARCGGHVGFMAQRPAGGRHAWLEQRLLDFLSLRLAPGISDDTHG